MSGPALIRYTTSTTAWTAAAAEKRLLLQRWQLAIPSCPFRTQRSGYIVQSQSLLSEGEIEGDSSKLDAIPSVPVSVSSLLGH